MIFIATVGLITSVIFTIILLHNSTFHKHYIGMMLFYGLVLFGFMYEVMSPVESGITQRQKIWTDIIGTVILPDSGFVIKEYHYTKSTLLMAILHDGGIWKYRVLGDDENE